MSTAKTIIDGALLDLQVKTAGVDLTDSEYNDSIVVMNQMMLSLDRNGIRLNYTVVSDKDEDITSPDWSEAMIRARLAIKLATMFGATISESLRLSVIDETSIVNNSIVSIIQPIPPNTLPRGAGHGTCENGGYSNSRFFQNTQADDLLFGNNQNMEDDEGVQLDQGGSNESR